MSIDGQPVAPYTLRQLLEQHGTADETSRHLITILEAANEDPTGFRVTSRYITAAACRGDGRR